MSMGFALGQGTAKRPVCVSGTSEDELVVLNGCVVTASRYLASQRALHLLEKDFWARMLLVRFKGFKVGHAYCVWELDGHLFGYDRAGGTFEIHGREKTALALAQALGKSMEKVLERSLVVEQAEFVTPENVSLSVY